MSRVEEEALDWFVRRKDGLPAADETRFQRWLAAHPAHARAYAQWEQDWQELDSLSCAAVDRLRHATPSAQVRPRATRQSRVKTWFALPRTMVAGAGVALLLACAVAGALWWQPMASASYVTAQDERIDTILADGSRLQLAPAGRAVFGIFRTRREIELPEGQARFEIRRDAARPLTVLAGGLRITVVGTRFTVHHGARGDEVRVAVEEGHVQVAPRGWFAAGGTVDLVAGQAVGTDAKGVLGTVSAVRAADLAPWHERRTSFENATLAEVLAAFGRHGDPGLVVRDPEVAALRLTGTFDLLRPDRFAQLLPRALPVRLEKNGASTEIRAR